MSVLSKNQGKMCIRDRLIKRQDELGDLSKAISSLQEEMIKSIANIAGNAEAVLMASGELGETARERDHNFYAAGRGSD